jgi:hypothetical protein
MADERHGRQRTESTNDTCVWCKKPFNNAAERKIHVSLLGAPGTFHVACFDEYTESEKT